MDKYATYLDLGTTRIEEQELDLFPFLDPTLRYSSTPTLLIYTLWQPKGKVKLFSDLFGFRAVETHMDSDGAFKAHILRINEAALAERAAV